jgi:hypothetical protein
MQQDTAEDLNSACNSLIEIAGQIRKETAELVSAKEHIPLIKHFDQLRLLNAVIKESREALKEIEEQLSREWVPDAMRSANVRTITIEGVGRVSLGTRWSASMPDKQIGMTWLRSNGHGGVIQETVNAQTLGALAKELGENGVELPAPTFTTSVMTYTSITKVK